MTLQIAFSGVVKPGRTLRMPTFPEQRFMAYESIINGARGLVYFGGGLQQTLNERDKPLGFNWTYWDRVMRPLFEEVGPKSPIVPALVAPGFEAEADASRPRTRPSGRWRRRPRSRTRTPRRRRFVQDETATDVSGIEFVVREVGDDVYVLACKKRGADDATSGSPACRRTASAGQVVFEEPRTVEVKDGSFADWFGPFEVHVYKFSRK